MAAAYFVTWESIHAPNLGNVVCLQNLFEGKPTVDAVYRYYCDVNAEAAFHEHSPTLRNLQVQERIYAIAGLMARRYDSMVLRPATYFAKNMQLTAQANTTPMNMDHTIQLMSQLDRRRGIGTYSDYIRVPGHSVPKDPPRPYTDFLPAYDDTWAEFLHAAASGKIRLPEVPIT